MHVILFLIFCTTIYIQLGVCALFMACKLGDVPTVEVLLGFQPDLSVREKVSIDINRVARVSGCAGAPMTWLACANACE